jgi:hypothetical protein
MLREVEKKVSSWQARMARPTNSRQYNRQMFVNKTLVQLSKIFCNS